MRQKVLAYAPSKKLNKPSKFGVSPEKVVTLT